MKPQSGQIKRSWVSPSGIARTEGPLFSPLCSPLCSLSDLPPCMGGLSRDRARWARAKDCQARSWSGQTTILRFVPGGPWRSCCGACTSWVAGRWRSAACGADDDAGAGGVAPAPLELAAEPCTVWKNALPGTTFIGLRTLRWHHMFHDNTRRFVKMSLTSIVKAPLKGR